MNSPTSVPTGLFSSILSLDIVKLIISDSSSIEISKDCVFSRTILLLLILALISIRYLSLSS